MRSAPLKRKQSKVESARCARNADARCSWRTHVGDVWRTACWVRLVLCDSSPAHSASSFGSRGKKKSVAFSAESNLEEAMLDEKVHLLDDDNTDVYDHEDDFDHDAVDESLESDQVVAVVQFCNRFVRGDCRGGT